MYDTLIKEEDAKSKSNTGFKYISRTYRHGQGRHGQGRTVYQVSLNSFSRKEFPFGYNTRDEDTRERAFQKALEYRDRNREDI